MILSELEPQLVEAFKSYSANEVVAMLVRAAKKAELLTEKKETETDLAVTLHELLFFEYLSSMSDKERWQEIRRLESELRRRR